MYNPIGINMEEEKPMMSYRDIKREGYQYGKNVSSWIDPPEKGMKIRPFECESFTGVVENRSDQWTVFNDMAWQLVYSNRQYADWVNSDLPRILNFMDSEECSRRSKFSAWDTFEKGIQEGIWQEFKSRTKGERW